MIDVIMEVQKSSEKSCTADEKAEFIAKACQRLSRPSRMFAQAVATATSGPLGFFHST